MSGRRFHRRRQAEVSPSRRRDGDQWRACPVCGLPDSQRVLIELALHQGAGFTWVSTHAGISQGGLRYHANRCAQRAEP